MMNRLISALFPYRSLSRRARIVWLCVLALSPLAYGVGIYLHLASIRAAESTGDVGLAIDRAQAIAIARKQAADHGVDTIGWGESVKKDTSTDVYKYVATQSEEMKRIIQTYAPPLTIIVEFRNPDAPGRWKSFLSRHGKTVGFEYRARRRGKAEKERGAEDELAERALTAFLGPSPPFTVKRDRRRSEEARGGGPLIYKYRWNAESPHLEGVKLSFEARVRDGMLTGTSSSAELATERPGRWKRWAWVGATYPIYVIAMLLFVLARYTRRAVEKEVSHRRGLVVMAFAMLFLYALVFSGDQFNVTDSDSPDALISKWIPLMFLAAFFGFTGWFIGAAYAATEGDLRETWPGKLTSVDALLLGKISSRNVGRSVLAGAAIGGWLLAVRCGVFRLTGPEDFIIETFWGRMPLLMSRIPWLSLGVRPPTMAMLACLLGLLLPLTFLRRWSKRRLRFYSCLLPIAFIGTLMVSDDAGLPWATGLIAAARLAALLIAFYGFDLLASIVSIGACEFLSTLVGVERQAPFLGHFEPVIFAGMGVVVVFSAWRAFRGREISDAEVRPRYAGYIAERVSLQAEVSAAREAQLRLLPLSPPVIAGLSISASCEAASHVGGDFYDFFVLGPSRLGILVTDGGGGGLATALSIALAKGYLMEKASAGLSPAETVQQLEATLGRWISEQHKHGGLCYAVIDVEEGTLRYARTGSTPNVLLPGKPRGPEREGTAQLQPGQPVLFYTDGVSAAIGKPERWLAGQIARHDAEPTDQILAAIRKSILTKFRGLRRRRIDDDVTLVLIRVEPAAAVTMERVA